VLCYPTYRCDVPALVAALITRLRFMIILIISLAIVILLGAALAIKIVKPPPPSVTPRTP
jgi:hypothetical protein